MHVHNVVAFFVNGCKVESGDDGHEFVMSLIMPPIKRRRRREKRMIVKAF